MADSNTQEANETTIDFSCAKIQLRPYQIPCVQSVLNIWKEGQPAIITAQTGSGKTYMAAMAAYAIKPKYVVVLGPLGSLPKWEEVLSLVFAKRRIFCYGYEAWKACGVKGCPNKRQPFTQKIQAIRANGSTGYDFEPTELWNKMVWYSKTVFILDEFHKLQKPSQRTFAVAANSRAIIRYICPSRVLALSYTPCDNIVDIPMHLYLLGTTDESALAVYNQSTKKYCTKGLNSILQLAQLFDNVSIEDINEVTNCKYLSGRNVHRRVNTIAGNLFLRYIRKALVFSCIPDFLNDPTVTPNYSNLFCRINTKPHKKIVSIIGGGGGEEKIPEAFEHQIDVDTVNMAILTSIQQKLEKIKQPIYLRLAKDWLKRNPTGKVIIMVLYLDTLDILCEELVHYNPARMEGNMNINQRVSAIRMFQAHNLDCRVFVGTITTGGESIDLHDTSPGGMYPRFLIIPPCFYTKPMIQSAGRVFRDSVTSRAEIAIVYTAPIELPYDDAAPYTAEMRFYEAVRRKTGIVKQYHAEGQNALLPCDYPTVITEDVYMTSLDYKEEGDFDDIDEF